MGDVLLRTLELAGMFGTLAAPVLVLVLVAPALHVLRGDSEALAVGRGLGASAAV